MPHRANIAQHLGYEDPTMLIAIQPITKNVSLGLATHPVHGLIAVSKIEGTWFNITDYIIERFDFEDRHIVKNKLKIRGSLEDAQQLFANLLKLAERKDVAEELLEIVSAS